MNLKIDKARHAYEGGDSVQITGIIVRAQYDDGSWGTADISQLEKTSLLEWLTKDEGSNKLAENVVGVLFGHGHLHPECDFCKDAKRVPCGKPDCYESRCKPCGSCNGLTESGD